jgi:hypothetical protein
MRPINILYLTSLKSLFPGLNGHSSVKLLVLHYNSKLIYVLILEITDSYLHMQYLHRE